MKPRKTIGKFHKNKDAHIDKPTNPLQKKNFLEDQENIHGQNDAAFTNDKGLEGQQNNDFFNF